MLEELISLPSPGTNEDAAQKWVIANMEALCEKVETDIYGSTVGIINGEAPARLLITAHVDEIGLIVSNIDEKGFLRVKLLGRSHPDALIGQRVVIHTIKTPVQGVIGRRPGASPERALAEQDLWIDIGALSREEAEKNISLGNTVTPECGYQQLGTTCAAGRGMDDRAGVAACMRALELIKENKKKPLVGVYFLSAVQEEGGQHRGAITNAFSIHPHAAIAVDVCNTTDIPGESSPQEPSVNLGGGPVISTSLTTNRAVNKLLCETAEKNNIPLQHTVEPRSTGTDADPIASSGEGVATGVLYIPCRYLHSPSEVISLSDTEHTARLLAEFILSLPETPEFRPIVV